MSVRSVPSVRSAALSLPALDLVILLEEFPLGTAIARFNSIFGKGILKKMNISLIDPDEVILDKQLLKGKI